MKRFLGQCLPDHWLLVRRRGAAGAGRVVLSFDDGPHPEMTPRLLDILAAHEIRAAFFVLGRAAGNYPEIMRRMVREGHDVGNHSFGHRRRFGSLPVAEQVADIRRAQETIQESCGVKPRFFRPPYGHLSLRLLPRLYGLGLLPVLWSRNSMDFKHKDPGQILKTLKLPRVRPGDIFLFHDDMQITLSVLPEILSRLRDQEFQAGTLTDFFKTLAVPLKFIPSRPL